MNEEKRQEGNADTNLSVHYFNAKNGYWEPAIEQFVIAVNMQNNNLLNTISLKFPKPINVNFSTYFAKVISEFQKFWAQS